MLDLPLELYKAVRDGGVLFFAIMIIFAITVGGYKQWYVLGVFYTEKIKEIEKLRETNATYETALGKIADTLESMKERDDARHDDVMDLLEYILARIDPDAPPRQPRRRVRP